MVKRSSVATHRVRKARAGFVRMELSVHKDDVPLVRQVAAALADPARKAEARVILRRRFAAPIPIRLKELLASAPLEGIELDRVGELGRDVDL